MTKISSILALAIALTLSPAFGDQNEKKRKAPHAKPAKGQPEQLGQKLQGKDSKTRLKGYHPHALKGSAKKGTGHGQPSKNSQSSGTT